MMMACAGSAAIAAPLHAQAAPAETLEIDKKRIDAALAAMIADGRAAGTSALIWQDGREVYFGAAGMADRAAKRPMRRDTIAQIYSMTKPVTGVALMQLWEQGRSEEHTSELQSLMRISYAVFCLKTKKQTQPIRNH